MPTAILLIPPMLHFLLFHFVKQHHSPPQVLSDRTVIRKYNGQGHGAREVTPGTQKRRTALDMVEQQHRRSLSFQGLPEQSTHHRENTCLSQLSVLRLNGQSSGLCHTCLASTLVNSIPNNRELPTCIVPYCSFGAALFSY